MNRNLDPTALFIPNLEVLAEQQAQDRLARQALLSQVEVEPNLVPIHPPTG